MKAQLRPHHFQDIIEIQEQLLTLLHAMLKRQFRQCFHSGRNTEPTALTWKEIGLVWFGLFFHPFSHTCNTGHVNYRLQFIYYNTTYIWTSIHIDINIGCPTTYQTRHFFNNSKTNEDIATKQKHSSSFLTQHTYSCSYLVAISSLVLELLKKCWVW